MKAITVRVGNLTYDNDINFEVAYDQVGAIFTGAANAGIAWLDFRSDAELFVMVADGFCVKAELAHPFQRAYGARCTLWVRRRP